MHVTKCNPDSEHLHLLPATGRVLLHWLYVQQLQGIVLMAAELPKKLRHRYLLDKSNAYACLPMQEEIKDLLLVHATGLRAAISIRDTPGGGVGLCGAVEKEVSLKLPIHAPAGGISVPRTSMHRTLGIAGMHLRVQRHGFAGCIQ